MKKLIIILALFITGCGGDDEGLILKPEAKKYLSISFDDGVALESIYDNLELFERYGAKVTYFMSHVPKIVKDPKKVEMLNEMQARGVELGYHGTWHQNANKYIAEHGEEKWINDEIKSGLKALNNVGIVPTSFAYPFGAHTERTNELLKPYFQRTRGFTTKPVEMQYFSNDTFVLAYSIDQYYLDLNRVYDGIDNIELGKTLYIASHYIGEHGSDWQIPVEDLELILNYADSQGIEFCSVRDCP